MGGAIRFRPVERAQFEERRSDSAQRGATRLSRQRRPTARRNVARTRNRGTPWGFVRVEGTWWSCRHGASTGRGRNPGEAWPARGSEPGTDATVPKRHSTAGPRATSPADVLGKGDPHVREQEHQRWLAIIVIPIVTA